SENPCRAQPRPAFARDIFETPHRALSEAPKPSGLRASHPLTSPLCFLCSLLFTSPNPPNLTPHLQPHPGQKTNRATHNQNRQKKQQLAHGNSSSTFRFGFFPRLGRRCPRSIRLNSS